jgi:hypothetical protein
MASDLALAKLVHAVPSGYSECPSRPSAPGNSYLSFRLGTGISLYRAYSCDIQSMPVSQHLAGNVEIISLIICSLAYLAWDAVRMGSCLPCCLFRTECGAE